MLGFMKTTTLSREEIKGLTIPPLAVTTTMNKDAAALRLNGPHFLRSILTQSRKMSFLLERADSLEITPITAGGMLSACYIVRHVSGDYLIKMRSGGIEAEHKAMSMWHKAGAHVGEIIASGVVPATRDSAKPIKYIVIGLVSDSNNQAAPTGSDFVKTHPERTRSVGYHMGVELAKMHRASTGKTFGEYGDMWGKRAPYRSMNSFLLSYLDYHHRNLLAMGIKEDVLKQLHKRIGELKFIRKGRYLHGDYSLRNVLVERSRPLKLVVIDPNPLIGDPAWDLAILFNNVYFAKRRLVYNPGQRNHKKIYGTEAACLSGLIEGYRDTTRHSLNEAKLKACQLVQAVFLMDIERSKAKKRHRNPDDQLEVMVRADAIKELINDFINIL